MIVAADVTSPSAGEARPGERLAVGDPLAPAPSPALAPPPGNPRFPLFDGLRGIAVLGILAFHVLELTGRIGIGVDGRFAEVAGFQAVVVFFVISGFLLYRPYVAAGAAGRGLPGTARYARRRALRILPAYWTVLTLLAVFPGVVGVFTGQWWRYYGYLQLYSTRTELNGIPVAWTLCVEVTFYLLLPVWALLVSRLHRRAGPGRLLVVELGSLACAMALGFAVQLAVAGRAVPVLLGSTLLGQGLWIALGMALAVVSVEVQRGGALPAALRWLAGRPAVCWAVAVAAFGVLMPLQPAGGLYGLIALATSRQSMTITAIKLVLQGVVAVALVVPAIFGPADRGLPRRILRLAPIAWLGVVSYSFYLWHLTVAEWIASDHSSAFSATGLNLLAHLHIARSFILYLLCLIATLALASLSYRFVELPFLRRKER